MGRGQITLQTIFFEELTATLQPKIPDRNFGSDGRVSARIYLYIHGQVYAYAHTIKSCLQRPRCISYICCLCEEDANAQSSQRSWSSSRRGMEELDVFRCVHLNPVRVESSVVIETNS